MVVKDYGSTVMFFGDCIKYAELHFTADFGRVLVVYPAALSKDSRKRWSGIESVRTAFQPDFQRIFARWNIDRVSIMK